MNNSKTGGKKFHSLIPLDDFKALMGIDDREEKTARFCLVTATCTIEQYCKRRLLRQKHIERIEFSGDLILPLREYPVVSINKEQLEISNGKIVEREFYHVIPDCGTDIDVPFYIELSPVFLRYSNLKYFKVVYTAGYVVNTLPCEAKTSSKASKTAGFMPQVPADLAAACLELAAWNMNRYKQGIRKIEQLTMKKERGEMFMPENVRSLIEPYKRRTI